MGRTHDLNGSMHNKVPSKECSRYDVSKFIIFIPYNKRSRFESCSQQSKLGRAVRGNYSVKRAMTGRRSDCLFD